jgi:hypothetical protein
MKCEYGMTCMYEPHASHFTPSSGQATEGETTYDTRTTLLTDWVLVQASKAILQVGCLASEASKLPLEYLWISIYNGAACTLRRLPAANLWTRAC